jgi:CRISPR-associated endonuclease Csn1
MHKTLGLDLGTNSIGWAIRDISEPENQIIDKGVLTFEKGVGEGKSGEFPLVQKRTESRSKRRNYQAEKYRKWALLDALIENKMCPLKLEELDEWRKYTKGIARRYPQSDKFIEWLRFDFNGDGKPDFEIFGFSKHENHYLFRMLAVSEDPNHKRIFEENPHILGRVLYHLVQRRGFRGRDEEEARTIMQGSKESGTVGVDAIIPFIQKYKTLGAALYHLNKEKNERIRKRYNLRTDYEQELKEICLVQNIDEDVHKKFWKAIIWQRPLRSQKGLVGVCTFENNKPRCPISHPIYEEYRTWVFINNLKIELPDGIDRVSYLTEKVYPLFYKKDRDFKLGSIVKELKKVGGGIRSKFQYSDADDERKKHEEKKNNETKVVSSTLLNNFKDLLGDDWQERYSWHESLQNQPKTSTYSIEDIWHILFTFDSREKLFSFGKEKLNLNDEDAEKFSKIKLQQGYATLSLSAIKKILPYLKQGFIYSHAIYLANLHKVLGKDQILYEEALGFSTTLKHIFAESQEEKLLMGAVNGLITDQLSSETRYGMNVDYQLDSDDRNDIEKKLEDIFGIKTWRENKTEEERQKSIDFVSHKYLEFLRRSINFKKADLFNKPERLFDKIFNHLHETYGTPEERKKYLWHPSEQETYPQANKKNDIPQLGDPQPISRGFKNPMALKTLHKLKSLLNYLLQTGKIDDDTRVVVEIARELNDANRRKAIERWQRERERENDEFKKMIQENPEAANFNLDITKKSIVDKYRLWIEQNRMCLYTGAMISFSDLFNGIKFDFEHTIPASISFDNELKNLTITDGLYNRQVKGNKFPTQLPNYDRDASIDGRMYSAIKPRVEFMEKKVADLETLFEEWTNKTKFASTKDIKDACVQRRHLIKFDLDYWRKKLQTFTLTEYKAGWRNSQLRDTQVVTKYAIPYLKTVFHKVEVEKGSVTSDFREIYGIQPRKEKKDRSKHSHHAVDAAVLTLIPPAAIRDQILLRYNESKDKHQNITHHEPVKNWSNFQPYHIISIEDEVLINFQPQQRTLVATYKNVRKRGKQQFVKSKTSEGKWQYKLSVNGEKIPLVAKGNTIRGQLHKESFFGAIKQSGERLLVERYPISSFTSINDCKHIVDDKVRQVVKETLEKRIGEGQPFDKAKLEPIPFPSGKEVIKKVRCKVAAGRGYLTPEKALEIKKHDSPSRHDYKQFVYAQNEENTLCLFYEKITDNKTERAFRVVGLYELAQLKMKNLEELKGEKYYQTTEAGRGKNKVEIPLSHIITVGTKVILYKESKEELKELIRKDILKRLFRVYKFNEPAPSTVYIYIQNHIEARTNEELGNGEKDVDLDKYQPRIFLNSSKFNCAIEGKEFNIKPDGEISWLF